MRRIMRALRRRRRVVIEVPVLLNGKMLAKAVAEERIRVGDPVVVTAFHDGVPRVRVGTGINLHHGRKAV